MNFKELLKSAKDDTERKAIAAHTEHFVTNLYESVFAHIEKSLEQDPDAIKKALLEIDSSLIKQEEDAHAALSKLEEDAKRNKDTGKSD